MRKRLIPIKLHFATEEFMNEQKELIGRKIVMIEEPKTIVGEIRCSVASDAVALIRLQYLKEPIAKFCLENDKSVQVELLNPFFSF